MLKIRPHHLLCMKGFRGEGYNDEFIHNMDRVVKEIKSDENIEIDLITKSDDICKCCPNTDEEKICVSKEKINELDFNVLKVLNIKEGTYKYRELNDMLMKLLTLKEFNKICEKCSWYSYGYCEEGIFKNKI